VTELRSAHTQPSKDHLHTQVRIFSTKKEGKSTNSQKIKVSMDPYLKDSQELKSGVPTRKSTTNRDLGFRNHGEKGRIRGNRVHLGEELDPRHLQQIEREGCIRRSRIHQQLR
jgi:hypothetical protein